MSSEQAVGDKRSALDAHNISDDRTVRWVVECQDDNEVDTWKEPRLPPRNVAKKVRTSVEDVGGKKRNEEENLFTTSRPNKDLLLHRDKGGKNAITVVMSDV